MTREIFFANILILIMKFIACGFTCICSYKGLEDEVKIRMCCFFFTGVI